MNVLVVAELLDGAPRRTTLSAIRAAQQITAQLGGQFDVLSIGEQSQQSAAALVSYGARAVLHAEVNGGYICENYAPTIAEVARSRHYDVIVATASSYGKDLMARVAAKLDSGLAPDVASLHFDSGRVRYKRAMFAGNLNGTLEVTSTPQVVTVRQSEFEPAEIAAGTPSTIETVSVTTDAVAAKIRFVSLEVIKSERPELTEADIVVAGGRALRSAENFNKYIEPLADLLGAAVGASRAACDAGYVSNQLQVGQTGKVVAPRLYIGIGISGAIQHLAGMKGSKTIVAINKDKEAPIAQVADYFLVADLFEAVPELTQKLRARTTTAT